MEALNARGPSQANLSTTGWSVRSSHSRWPRRQRSSPATTSRIVAARAAGGPEVTAPAFSATSCSRARIPARVARRASVARAISPAPRRSRARRSAA
ncbi:hypothetical protein Adeh_2134 [Anaeromyxobacter dehalogenans 2CP-C]|uniref:Uncharacterized protein n=1 Tax=Anaeromyxobacter dehalogenans (strain 2CP-C) TaxID=290397 RepID=Q2IJS6_ANADE|nr:hypothetical protein Adeh_2134 [Anaeromyxobacter dehalogenans 2CP-C]